MKKILMFILLVTLVLPASAIAENPTAKDIVIKCWDYMRGRTSVSIVHMTVHRPDWERKSTIKAWTMGRENSIFKIIAPARDKGNGTLKLGTAMWTYNPKINRVVKIPPSMMSQSWMGSDFSNNDLSKADSIVVDYKHEIVGTEKTDQMTIYSIKAMPKPDAPVVWGMQMLKIREDGVIVEQAFHDEDMEPVKILSTTQIKNMGGRPFPSVWTMRFMDAETEDEYTLLKYESLEFDVKLRRDLFTINALKRSLR